mmetsp:Transcript_17566/g.33413  ORF Transcript_17566/g.33413 Transcript_17566/m.33413 type:complete len:316 (-) Transcript_17566:119-1066(-)
MANFIRESLGTCSYHLREGNVNWPMLLYISLTHIAGFTGLLYITSSQWQTLLWAFVLWPVTAFGITGGVHRLWSHRSYKANFLYRFPLMLANSMANQGSIYHWSRDHRVHHKHSETDADPHNAKRGFFFAHVGWLLVKKHPDVIKAGRELDLSDLEADWIVMIQEKLDPWFNLFMCFVFPALVGTYGWGEDFWTGFYVAGALRYMYVLHITWLVNSAAHLYGDHPYDPQSWPAENPFVSLGSIGEGWHNWHHKYPFDYAASEFGVTSQFNPTKMIIDLAAAVGMVKDRKRATGAWNRLKEMRDEMEAEKVLKKVE